MIMQVEHPESERLKSTMLQNPKPFQCQAAPSKSIREEQIQPVTPITVALLSSQVKQHLLPDSLMLIITITGLIHKSCRGHTNTNYTVK